jgi:hypothetical protein
MSCFIGQTRIAGLLLSLWLAAPFPMPARGAAVPVADRLERAEGKWLDGTFIGNAREGFRFVPGDGSAAIPIVGPAELRLGGVGPMPTAGVPPVQVVLGYNQWVSGQLVEIDGTKIRLADGPGGKPVTVERNGALAVRQRRGEALVLIDGFETLDPARWTHVGTPRLVNEPKLAGEKSLRLEADGTAITSKIAVPIAQGRLELAYHDTASVSPGAQWFVDLLFRGEGGPETLRAVLGWNEDSLAVQSPAGPAMAVQRLARKPGWHRLEVRFGPEAAEMAVDGDALAHGKGPTGPLVEIRIGTTLSGDPPKPMIAAHIDEIRLVRLTSVVSSSEADPDQDEARLVEGDQIFGEIRRADAQNVVIEVLSRQIVQPWSAVTALHFRRVAKPSREVGGLLTRLEWRSAPGTDPRDIDAAEGALLSASADAFTLETPYAGTLVIPRDRLRRLVVEGWGRRIVVDPMAHHLGDEVFFKPPDLLDPPQPEGGTLERTFTLAKVPELGREASLVFDVVQVAGEANGLEFSDFVRRGELRTNVSINGREFDYLNKHITTRNDIPERIRLPIPRELLKAGENRITIKQAGKLKDPNYLDDLGVLGIALEIAQPAPKP